MLDWQSKDCLSERCLNNKRLIVCLFCRLTIFWVCRGKGKAIDSSVQEGQEGRRAEGILLIPKRPQSNPWIIRGLLQKVAWVSSLLILFEVLLFIGIMKNCTSESSNYSFFTSSFDGDMKQDLSTMMDIVREMYEDGRKSNILRE